MIAHSVQLTELMPSTFVKVLLNNGIRKFGFLLNPETVSKELLLVSGLEKRDSLGDVSIEAIEMDKVISIDAHMR
jgi:hypothetical protein